MKKQLVDMLWDHTTVKNWRNAFHSVRSVAIVAAVMTAAMETERSAGMNASTSSTVTMRSMTAMVYVFRKPSNVTNSVPQRPMEPLPLFVAKMMKQHADLSQNILLSELVKRLGDVSITSSPVVQSAETATSIVEMSVAMHQNIGCVTDSVLKIICNATGFVLKKE